MFGIVSSDVIRPIQGLREKQVFIKFLTNLPNRSVGVTVIVAKFVNSSIYFFGFFFYFLCFTLDLCILGLLECLMISGSIKSR